MVFNQVWQAKISDRDEWFNATVPGNVQKDYADFIGIDDLMYSTNTKLLEEIENSTFVYKTFLQYNADNNEKVYFVARGIDYIYDIMLDGVCIYSGEGMYSKVELDITEISTVGSELQVIIYPHPKKNGSRMGTRDEASASCKPPYCYGWDWNPRLLTSGLWLPAYIETRSADYIYRCEPTYNLDYSNRIAKVKFITECSSDVKYTVFDMQGNIVYSGYETEFVLSDVKLWWCNGHGEAYLYSWIAETTTDKKSGNIGFKTLELKKNKGTRTEPLGQPKSRYAAPITVKLNGKRIFAKGSNYVNPEIFIGNAEDEVFYNLVKAAKDANMNILRVWGGSGMTKPAFYDACDRLGILVWQEFMLSCNDYKGTKHYLSVLEREATAIILELRSHASLAFWCGGNELFNNWSGMDDQSKPLRLLNKLCYELDEERPFLSTSPLEMMGHGGYLFRYDDGRDVLNVYTNSRFTAYSEFGVPSISRVESLKKIIPEDELFPIKETASWVHHHGFNAWGKPRWLCLNVLKHYFGELQSIDEVYEKSQWLQSLGYKYIFEEARRQWPYCSMALNWCLNEPWITAANNSIISYPCIKKPAYFSVSEALKPVMPSARILKFDWKDGEIFKAEIWYHNESDKPVFDTVNISIKLGDEVFDVLTWNTGEVMPQENKQGPTISYKLPRIEIAESVELICSFNESKEKSIYKLLYRCTPIKKQEYMLNV